MLKLDKFLSRLQIFYTDCKFLRSVTSNLFSLSWWYVLKTSLQDILKMSWRRLKDVFAKRSWRRLGKTSWRSLEDALKTSSKQLEDVLKMSWRRFWKTSWRHLENVLKTSWRQMAKTNIMVLIKMSWRRLEDVFWRCKYKANIFALIKTSWRRLLKTKTKDDFKTSSKRLHRDECLVGWKFIA